MIGTHIKRIVSIVSVAGCFFTFSCTGPGKLYEENLYFKDSAAVVGQSNLQFKEPAIEVNDLLFIQVQTADARMNALFNNSSQIQNQSTSASLLQGYQVGIDSAINFPVLGKIYVAGLTRNEVEKALVTKVGEYIKEKPSIQVRFLNYKINILGEVAKPGTYSFPTDRVTILDALGMAGDVTIFARRNKVWLIREVNQKRAFYFINLQDSKTFSADTYFLRQNDVVYVEPSSKKFILSDPTYNRTAQNISIGLSSVGLIIALISLLR
jgi:polysaccharide biosynthesis/export protein